VYREEYIWVLLPPCGVTFVISMCAFDEFTAFSASLDPSLQYFNGFTF
jgi:hypothetical protein